MYLLHKLLIALVFLSISGLAYCFNLKVESDFESNLFTLVGIMFGFTISASVAMKGSNFLNRQSYIIDKTASGLQMTNQQRLCKYIYVASILDLVLIILLLVFNFLPRYEILLRTFSSLVIGIVSIVVFSSFLLLRIILKFLMSEN